MDIRGKKASTILLLVLMCIPVGYGYKLSIDLSGYDEPYYSAAITIERYIKEHHPETKPSEVIWIVTYDWGGEDFYGIEIVGYNETEGIRIPNYSPPTEGKVGWFEGTWMIIFSTGEIKEDYTSYKLKAREGEQAFSYHYILVNSDRQWWNVYYNIEPLYYIDGRDYYIVYGWDPEDSRVILEAGYEPPRTFNLQDPVIEKIDDVMKILEDLKKELELLLVKYRER